MWERKKKFTVEHDGYVFHYDTAIELARMVKESGCKMPIPYEPMTTDYDDWCSVMAGDL